MLNLDLFDLLAVATAFSAVLAAPRRKMLLAFLASLLATAGGYIAFVDYLQHPWFMTDPMNCDGPCFGWYKLEDTIIPKLLVLIAEALGGALVGFFARASGPALR